MDRQNGYSAIPSYGHGRADLDVAFGLVMPALDRDTLPARLNRGCNVIRWMFCRMKDRRRIDTRCDRPDKNCLSVIAIVARLFLNMLIDSPT